MIVSSHQLVIFKAQPWSLPKRMYVRPKCWMPFQTEQWWGQKPAHVSSLLPLLLYLFHFGSVSKGKGHFVFHLIVTRKVVHVKSLRALWRWWSLSSFHSGFTTNLGGTLLLCVASKAHPHFEVGSPVRDSCRVRWWQSPSPVHMHRWLVQWMWGMHCWGNPHSLQDTLIWGTPPPDLCGRNHQSISRASLSSMPCRTQ